MSTVCREVDDRQGTAAHIDAANAHAPDAPTRATGSDVKDFDWETAVRMAKQQIVRFDAINPGDRKYCVRENVDAACDSKDLVAEEDGTVDFSRDHPVVLLRDGTRYLVVNGFRRLEAMPKMGEIEQIRCLVLGSLTEDQVVIVATRINLQHGRMLSLVEKRKAFLRERNARERTGSKPLSDRAWARAYRVAPTTIGNWLRKEDEASPQSARTGAARTGVPQQVSAGPSGQVSKVGHTALGSADAGPKKEPAVVCLDPGQAGIGSSPRPKGPKPGPGFALDRLLIELRTAVQIFLDGVANRPLSASQRAELAAVIAPLQAEVQKTSDAMEAVA
jgi:hypothetical protein